MRRDTCHFQAWPIIVILPIILHAQSPFPVWPWKQRTDDGTTRWKETRYPSHHQELNCLLMSSTLEIQHKQYIFIVLNDQELEVSLVAAGITLTNTLRSPSLLAGIKGRGTSHYRVVRVTIFPRLKIA